MAEPGARRLARALAPLLPLLVAACDSPLEACRSERIEVVLPATIERASATETVELIGTVGPGNVGAAEFETLREVLTGDQSAPAGAVVWTVPAFGTNPGWVAVAHRAPVAVGDVLPVEGSYDGAGWGAFDLGAGMDLLVSIRTDGFTATSAHGSAEVLDVAPLRLRLDLTAEDAEESIRVRGTASFRYVSEPSPCT